ncbi:MAG: GNAT family N-acetyltransferase [Cyanobacteria bacterium P01_F01_bin.13]
MSYLIRTAHPSDVEHLPAIEKAAVQQYVPYLSQLGLTPDHLENIVSINFLYQAQQQGCLWVATLQNTQISPLVGFVVVNRWADSFFVVELDVLPDYERQGIGSALINQVINAACSQGLDKIILTTFRHIPWTIPFYHRLGFEIVVPENYTPDIRAIVDHEERHGFSRQVRVVMQCQISNQIPIHSAAG